MMFAGTRSWTREYHRGGLPRFLLQQPYLRATASPLFRYRGILSYGDRYGGRREHSLERHTSAAAM